MRKTNATKASVLLAEPIQLQSTGFQKKLFMKNRLLKEIYAAQEAARISGVKAGIFPKYSLQMQLFMWRNEASL